MFVVCGSEQLVHASVSVDENGFVHVYVCTCISDVFGFLHLHRCVYMGITVFRQSLSVRSQKVFQLSR